MGAFEIQECGLESLDFVQDDTQTDMHAHTEALFVVITKRRPRSTAAVVVTRYK